MSFTNAQAAAMYYARKRNRDRRIAAEGGGGGGPALPALTFKYATNNSLGSLAAGYFSNNSASLGLATKWGFSLVNSAGEDVAAQLANLVAGMTGSPHKASVLLTCVSSAFPADIGSTFTFYINSVDTVTGSQQNYTTSRLDLSSGSASLNDVFKITSVTPQ